MKARSSLLYLLAVALLCGCRQNPHVQVYIDSLNAEKRILEDKLHELQFDCEAKEEELERLRRQLAEAEAGESRPPAKPSSPLPLGGAAEPPPEPPPSADLPPLSVDPGQSTNPESGPPTAKPKPTPDAAPDDLPPEPLELDFGEPGTTDEAATELPALADRQVTQLSLDPARTGILDADNAPGDDHLRIVFQPQNQSGQYVPQPGNVSVVLLDPVKRTRVARWDWNEAEVRAALAQPDAAEGIELRMPWRDELPPGQRVHLFVRFTPADGQQIETDREITLALSGRVASRWTPRAPEPTTRDSAQAHTSRGHEPGVPGEAKTEPASTARGDSQFESSRQAQRPQWRPYR